MHSIVYVRHHEGSMDGPLHRRRLHIGTSQLCDVHCLLYQIRRANPVYLLQAARYNSISCSRSSGPPVVFDRTYHMVPSLADRPKLFSQDCTAIPRSFWPPQKHDAPDDRRYPARYRSDLPT